MNPWTVNMEFSWEYNNWEHWKYPYISHVDALHGSPGSQIINPFSSIWCSVLYVNITCLLLGICFIFSVFFKPNFASWHMFLQPFDYTPALELPRNVLIIFRNTKYYCCASMWVLTGEFRYIFTTWWKVFSFVTVV